jgi:signal transduction histidine kinase
MASATDSPASPANRTSLRFRLAAALVLLGVAVLAGQALVVAHYYEQQEEEFIDDILDGEMPQFIARSGGAPQAAISPLITGYVVRSAPDRGRLPFEFRALPEGLHDVFISGREYHVVVRHAGGVEYYLAYDVSRHETRIRAFKEALLALLVGSLVALVGVSIWLSGVLARQVGDLARRVDHLDPAAPQDTLADHYRDREVVTLAAAFDAYARRVASLLGREKEFTGNVSHELRTPLTTIKTGCELLAQDGGLSDRSRARVHAIAASADHIAGLIDALLLLGREVPIEAESVVSLAEVAEEAAAPLRAAFEAKGLRFVVDVAPSAIARVNRTALQLTLTNLLKNAVVYTDGGEIRVRWVDGVLAVSDTGVGIAPADLPHIFQRAFRGANARASGTGIGLAIVRRIAERFGWCIDAESEPGRGTTFRIALASSPKLHG